MRLLALILLTGCATSFDYARDAAPVRVTAAGNDKGEVSVVWRFGTADEVNRFCNWKKDQWPPVHACAILDEKGGRCFMYTQKPAHFQDEEKLKLMGHEMLHCLGWKHS